jgi:hypothetical protein
MDKAKEVAGSINAIGQHQRRLGKAWEAGDLGAVKGRVEAIENHLDFVKTAVEGQLWAKLREKE